MSRCSGIIIVSVLDSHSIFESNIIKSIRKRRDKKNGFECSCDEGFVGDGFSCSPKKEQTDEAGFFNEDKDKLYTDGRKFSRTKIFFFLF